MRRIPVILLLLITFGSCIQSQVLEVKLPLSEDVAVSDFGGAASQSQDKASEPAPAQAEGNPSKSGRRGSFVAAPLPISSPAIGTGIVPVVAYIFPVRKSDEVSPPSVIGVLGLATDNDSRALALGADLFFKEDTYHVTTIYAHGNLNYDLYGIGAAAGNAGIKLPLQQDGQALLVQAMRRIGWKFFLGPRLIYGSSLVTVRPNNGSSVPIPPDVGLQTSLTSIGARLQRDTRPNRFYPTGGTFLDFTADFFAHGLGSKYSFQSYRGTFNKYWGLSENQVLAYNLYICGTGGKPPFYGNCIYGTNNELRGYTAGQYLDRYMFATQLEYRLVLP